MNIVFSSFTFRILSLLTVLLSYNLGPVYARPGIHLASSNWEPYTGLDLPEQGYFSELVSKAFEKVGYSVEFEYFPWVRALHTTQHGDIDGLMTVYFTKERSTTMEFSSPILSIQEVFISHHDNPIHYDGNLTSLQGYTIGIMRGSTEAEELVAAGANIERVANQRQNVQKLILGRVDAVVIPQEVFFTILEQLEPSYDKSNFKVQSTPFKNYEMHLAFSKQRAGYKKITEDFNKGLQLIVGDGTYDFVQQKHLQEYR